jgi:hypothetical protein
MSSREVPTDARPAGSSAAPCHNPGESPPAGILPWSGDPRASDKTDLLEYVRQNPTGVRPTVAARAVLDPDATAPDRDDRLARRTFENHPDLFKTTRLNGETWVEPTPEAYRRPSLDTASKHTVDTGGEPGDGDGIAVSNAEAILGRRRTVEDDAVRGDLLGAFGAKREATEDRFRAFEDSFRPGSYRLVPYATRFNSGRRVAETRDRYGTAWDRGREVGPNPGTATIVTVTTDPGRYDSLLNAAEGLLDDVNLLKKWVGRSPESRPTRIGERVPTLVVPEFTERGLPHVHVVFFGVGWVAKHSALSRYWSENRDRGEVVWFDRLRVRGGRWRWVESAGDRSHPDVRGRTPREYLREGIDLLSASAEATAAEVREAANALRAAGRTDRGDEDGGDAGDVGDEGGDDALDRDTLDRGRDLWRVALRWGTSLPVFTASPELKAEDGGQDRATAPDGTPLPEDAPSRWRYVGTARYGEFPRSIRENATVLRRGPGPPTSRPPPDAGDAPSTRVGSSGSSVGSG